MNGPQESDKASYPCAPLSNRGAFSGLWSKKFPLRVCQVAQAAVRKHSKHSLNNFHSLVCSPGGCKSEITVSAVSSEASLLGM